MTLRIFCLSLLLVPLVFGLSLLPLLLQSPNTSAWRINMHGNGFIKITGLGLGCPRNKQKYFSVRTETNRNKICFAFVSVCFVKPKTKSFGLFRFFESVSKQPKQTELFHNKPKQTGTTLNFLKNTQIYSLLNCLGGSSVCFGSIETLCFGIEAKQPKHRNKLFRNKPKKPSKKTKKTEKT